MTKLVRHQNRQYTFKGPPTGSQWDTDHVVRVLQRVSAIVREVHEHAGFPSADFLGTLETMPSKATVYCVLTGSRLPSWRLTWQVAHTLAIRANYTAGALSALRQRLHNAYSTPING